VIPVAGDGFGQKLLRLRRTGEDTFEEEDCGEVAFVPLIGAEAGARPARSHRRASPRRGPPPRRGRGA
jgi:protein-L-isoaspartate O-methyltransferase